MVCVYSLSGTSGCRRALFSQRSVDVRLDVCKKMLHMHHFSHEGSSWNCTGLLPPSTTCWLRRSVSTNLFLHGKHGFVGSVVHLCYHLRKNDDELTILPDKTTDMIFCAILAVPKHYRFNCFQDSRCTSDSFLVAPTLNMKKRATSLRWMRARSPPQSCEFAHDCRSCFARSWWWRSL